MSEVLRNISNRVWLATLAGFCAIAIARERPPQSTDVTVHGNHGDCLVELDSKVVGKTNSQGKLLLQGVEPGDHYMHVLCSNEGETVYFITLLAGQKVEVPSGKAGTASLGGTGGPMGVAETKIELTKLVQQAAELRAQGQLEEAVKELREAMKLDPENSDLHRELGITFLVGKDWKRARIEMLEAIRHEPGDADAHNGLGYALEKLGDMAEALKEYRLATRLEPDDPTYRTHYIDALARLSEQKSKKRQ
jgi:tetratricopeptide (TPR) repeat protein